MILKEKRLKALVLKRYLKLKKYLKLKNLLAFLNLKRKYQTVETIQARLFFKILKSGDLRHLFVKGLPDYSPEYLVPIWEAIKNQYELESNDNTVSSQLEDVNEAASELNDLTRLKAIYGLMRLGVESSIKELEEVGIVVNGINADSIKLVWIEIQSLQENIEIGLMVEQQKTDYEKGEEFNFYKSLQTLSNLFHRNIPVDISLIEWIYLIEEAKEYKKRNRHGKS